MGVCLEGGLEVFNSKLSWTRAEFCLKRQDGLDHTSSFVKFLASLLFIYIVISDKNKGAERNNTLTHKKTTKPSN